MNKIYHFGKTTRAFIRNYIDTGRYSAASGRSHVFGHKLDQAAFENPKRRVYHSKLSQIQQHAGIGCSVRPSSLTVLRDKVTLLQLRKSLHSRRTGDDMSVAAAVAEERVR